MPQVTFRSLKGKIISKYLMIEIIQIAGKDRVGEMLLWGACSGWRRFLLHYYKQIAVDQFFMNDHFQFVISDNLLLELMFQQTFDEPNLLGEPFYRFKFMIENGRFAKKFYYQLKRHLPLRNRKNYEYNQTILNKRQIQYNTFQDGFTEFLFTNHFILKCGEISLVNKDFPNSMMIIGSNYGIYEETLDFYSEKNELLMKNQNLDEIDKLQKNLKINAYCSHDKVGSDLLMQSIGNIERTFIQIHDEYHLKFFRPAESLVININNPLLFDKVLKYLNEHNQTKIRSLKIMANLNYNQINNQDLQGTEQLNTLFNQNPIEKLCLENIPLFVQLYAFEFDKVFQLKHLEIFLDKTDDFETLLENLADMRCLQTLSITSECDHEQVLDKDFIATNKKTIINKTIKNFILKNNPLQMVRGNRAQFIGHNIRILNEHFEFLMEKTQYILELPRLESLEIGTLRCTLDSKKQLIRQPLSSKILLKQLTVFDKLSTFNELNENWLSHQSNLQILSYTSDLTKSLQSEFTSILLNVFSLTKINNIMNTLRIFSMNLISSSHYNQDKYQQELLNMLLLTLVDFNSIEIMSFYSQSETDNINLARNIETFLKLKQSLHFKILSIGFQKYTDSKIAQFDNNSLEEVNKGMKKQVQVYIQGINSFNSKNRDTLIERYENVIVYKTNNRQFQLDFNNCL